MTTLFSESEIDSIIPLSMKSAFIDKVSERILSLKNEIFAEVIFELCKNNEKLHKDYILFTLRSSEDSEDFEEMKNFTMPTFLLEVKNLYFTNSEFKKYVDLNIAPFLNDMDSMDLVQFLFSSFPEFFKNYSDVDVYHFICYTRNALFKDNDITEQCYAWCHFFFNFSTIEKMLEFKASSLSS